MGKAVNTFMHPANNKPNVPAENPNASISKGNGGIPASLKVKAAGTKDAPGVDKNVNQF